MNITFIGNCQSVSLCFYFQQLLDSNIQWIMYGEEFREHLGYWSQKVLNKIVDYEKSLDTIKHSDVIVFQEICKEKSGFSNTETLQTLKKDLCKLIKIPSIYLNYSKFDVSIQELKTREQANKVDITVSDIFEKYRKDTLMLTCCHPTTFLFLEVVNELCKILKIASFSEAKRNMFLKDTNYIKLP
jgi:hypothetical protein